MKRLIATFGCIALAATAAVLSPDPEPAPVVAPVAQIAPSDFGSLFGAFDYSGEPTAAETSSSAWRSALYPASWLPLDAGGVADSQGRFLHDFSHAGYQTGNVAIPATVGANIQRTVLASTYGDGASDATNGIQQAIDQVCGGGGGTVNLGAGTFRIRPQGTNGHALKISCSNLILRGGVDTNGIPTTKLFNDQPVMRLKRVILVGAEDYTGPGPLYDTAGNVATNKTAITQDLLLPTRTIPVASVSGYAVNDWIAITADWSTAFRTEHGMTGTLWPADKAGGLFYYRRVKAINATARTLTIDIPTRYPLKTRDNARVYEPRALVANVGIENIQIGMVENRTPGTGDADYDNVGTGAYEMHLAAAIRVVLTRNSWIRNVRSFRPASNTANVHLTSIGITITASTRGITVENNWLQRPQYRGGGGNGYLFYAQGNDSLFRDNIAFAGRHNFILASPASTGNVFLRNSSESTRDDFHQYLSAANLFDQHLLRSALLEAINRDGASGGAGITSAQSVFWNTLRPSGATGTFISSNQFGWGYVIGTQGQTDGVNATNEWIEGLGIGANLEPQSLYEDQKTKRAANPNY